MTDTATSERVAEIIADTTDCHWAGATVAAEQILGLEEIEEGLKSRIVLMEIFDAFARSNSSDEAHEFTLEILNRFADQEMFEAFVADQIASGN